MHRTFVTMLALVALLTQALVSVSAGAVLCIKAGGDPCGVMAVPAACTCCCAEKEAPQRTVIHLCTPCHDDCNDCIEVDLPDETLPMAVKSLELSPAAFLATALNVEHTISDACAPRQTMVRGAGPPHVQRHPDTPVIESTILLL